MASSATSRWPAAAAELVLMARPRASAACRRALVTAPSSWILSPMAMTPVVGNGSLAARRSGG
jgi:hypothetical protein